jgi:hypothetical protein
MCVLYVLVFLVKDFYLFFRPIGLQR